MKYCSRYKSGACLAKQNPQALEEFTKDSTAKSGFRNTCRVCCSHSRGLYRQKYPEKHREYRIKNKLRIYDSSYRYKYGISMQQKAEMFVQQEQKCGACEMFLEVLSKAHVDHDHKTGKVRGLLCAGCNKAEGLLKANPENVLKLYKYLRRTA